MAISRICPSCGGVLSTRMDGLCPECVGRISVTDEANGESPGENVLGDYVLLEEIARGGMGLVFKARQISLNRNVAVKIMLGSPYISQPDLRRFRAEALAAASLTHPNIVPIHEVGEADGRMYFSMKLFAGGNLRAFLNNNPAQDAQKRREFVFLLSKVARAIHHAHERGILHRDLKPENILIENGEPCVADFGLAKFLHDGEASLVTHPGAVLGTPSYMSPEQARADQANVTTATDIFSLGVLLYEGLTGSPPFKADTPLETMRRLVDCEPERPRAIGAGQDHDLETVCLKCLEKEPKKRYTSALALAEDLERWLRHEPIQARSITTVERVGKWVKRHPAQATLYLVIITAVLLVTCVALVYNTRLRHSNEQVVSALRNQDLSRVENLYEEGKQGEALSLLARVLRDHPDSERVAQRLYYALIQQNLLVPAGEPFRTTADTGYRHLRFTANGERIIAADPHRVRIFDLQKQSFITDAPSNSWAASMYPNNHGTILATYDEQGFRSLRFWNTVTGGLNGLITNISVKEVYFSPSGAFCATSGDEGVVFWDTSDAREITRLPGGHAPSFSSDGKWGSSVLRDKVVVLDLQSGRRVAFLPATNVHYAFFLPRHPDVLFTANKEGSFRYFHIPTGDSLPPPGADSTNASSGHISIVRGNNLKVVDIERGVTIFAPPDFATPIRTAGVSQSGRHLIAITTDDECSFWGLDTGRLLGHFRKLDVPFYYWAFLPGEREVVLFSASAAQIWRVAESKPVSKVIPCTLKPVLSPDGQWVLFAQMNVASLFHLPSASMWPEVVRTERSIGALAFSPDSKTIIIGSGEGTAQRWRISPAGYQPMEVQHPGGIRAAEFSPSGNAFFTYGFTNGVSVWETSTGRSRARWTLPDTTIFDANWDPTGKKIVVGSSSGAALLMDAISGKPLLPSLKHDASEVYDARFSPDGKYIATSGHDNTVRLWDPASGSPHGAPLPHPEPVHFAAFSRDLKRIASAGLRGSYLWEINGAKLIAKLTSGDWVSSIEFTPDGRSLIVAAGTTVTIHDAYSGNEIRTSIRHPSTIQRTILNRPGSKLLIQGQHEGITLWDMTTMSPVPWALPHLEELITATLSLDGNVIFATKKLGVSSLLDAATGFPLSQPFANCPDLFSAKFSADGQWLLTLHREGSAKIWPVLKPDPQISRHLPALAESLATLRLTTLRVQEKVPPAEFQRLVKQLSTNPVVHTNSGLGRFLRMD